MLEQILVVGHCLPDTFMLKSKMQQLFPDVNVDSCNSHADLKNKINSSTLLLVNRVLDGAFTNDAGIALIADLAKADEAPKQMLISNFEESQEEAIVQGAIMGFGKAEMGSSETEDKLKKVVLGD